MTPEERPRKGPARLPGLLAAKRKRALVVDDDQVICQLLETYLGRKGWEAVIAADGEEALSRLKRGRFSLALVDVVLEGVAGGCEVARRLLDREPGLRVVLMSGSPKDGDRAEEAGFKVLRKPFDLSKIAAVLPLD